MDIRGWQEADVILFSADAYVDHPSSERSRLLAVYLFTIESIQPGEMPKKSLGRPSFLKSRKSPCQSG